MSRLSTPVRGIADSCPLCEGVFGFKEDGSCKFCGYQSGKKRRQSTRGIARRRKKRFKPVKQVKDATSKSDEPVDKMHELGIIESLFQPVDMHSILQDDNGNVPRYVEYVDEAFDVPYDVQFDIQEDFVSPLNLAEIDNIIGYFYPGLLQ